VDLSRSLAGRVALVTGAGRGIGRAHALELADRGAAVVVCDVGAELDGAGRDASIAHAVADEIVARGGRARADDSDVSSFTGGARAVDAALDAFGRLDIVVNNAGLAVSEPIESVTEADLDRVLGVNFVGPVGVVQAAWPALVRSGHGRVVNTVSEVAFDTRQSGRAVGYAAAKAAVWSLTLTLAEAGRELGITVNAVSPAAFTRMNEAMFREQGRPAGLDLDPVHVARVVAWLVSDDAADVTGRVVHVAGGQHREYTVRRDAETDLVARIDSAVRGARPTASAERREHLANEGGS
jgi:NAD(P)-dependent dehydrogenase (short-subunit alcohol dehydrogenase family)